APGHDPGHFADGRPRPPARDPRRHRLAGPPRPAALRAHDPPLQPGSRVMKARQAGFTVVEVCISAVFLSAILAIGVSVSRNALMSADRTVMADVVATRLDAALDRIRGQFVAASRGTLQAIPIGKFVAEPMQDGVVYDNVQFRRVAGVSVGAPLYAPPLAKPPL